MTSGLFVCLLWGRALLFGALPQVEYLGGNAVAEIAGQHVFAPASEPVSYDIASRRSSDAFLDYDWNAANQPLSLTQKHGPYRTEHVYDGQQRRVEKRVYKHGNLQQVHRFVYEGWLPVVEEVSDKWDNLIYRNLYVWGPGPNGVRNPAIGATGQLALIIHQPKTGPAQLSAPVYNHRLDVVGLVDVETGAVVARYGYTPFGETTHAVGPRAEHCPFRFAGAYWDDETETAYFGYRHYHPRSKQWISRDPIGEAGGLNLFAYADNDPINGIDILGLISEELKMKIWDFQYNLNSVLKPRSIHGVWLSNETIGTYGLPGKDIRYKFQEVLANLSISHLENLKLKLDYEYNSSPWYYKIYDKFEYNRIKAVLNSEIDDVKYGLFIYNHVPSHMRNEYSRFEYNELFEGVAGLQPSFDIALAEFIVGEKAISFTFGRVSKFLSGRFIRANSAVRDRVMSNIAASQRARAASNFPTTAAQNAELLSITERASRITDRMIKNGSSYWARVYKNPALRGQKFAAAFNRNPNLARALIRGNIIDDVSKQLVVKAKIPFLRITPRGRSGADFVNNFLGRAWDVTTQGSWQGHVLRYADEYELLLPLFY